MPADHHPIPAAPRQPLFINLWRRRDRHGAISYQADPYTERDEAAADAASPSLYDYAGTVVVAPAAAPRLLDLSGQGAAVLAERRTDAAEEAAYARGLTEAAGRTVL